MAACTWVRAIRLFSAANCLLLSLLAGTVVAAIPLGAQSVPGNDDSQALTTLVQRFTKAQQSFDPATLKELTSEDYVEVSPIGDVDSRARMLGFYNPDKKIEAPAIDVKEVDVRRFGNAAVVIAKLSYDMRGPDNKSHTMELRSTFVAYRSSSGWKLVSSQYTGIRPPRTGQ